MLPQTFKFFSHPRVQAEPLIANLVARMSDMGEFEKMSHEELALAFGFFTGFCQTLLEELDDLKGTKH